MDDLNTILGIVTAIPVVTLFTVYWLDARASSTPAASSLRTAAPRGESLHADHMPCGWRCRMPM
jgi:hypothetical protein